MIGSRYAALMLLSSWNPFICVARYSHHETYGRRDFVFAFHTTPVVRLRTDNCETLCFGGNV